MVILELKISITNFSVKWQSSTIIGWCRNGIRIIIIYSYALPNNTISLKTGIKISKKYQKMINDWGPVAQLINIECIPWMHYKSLWIKAFVKSIDINDDLHTLIWKRNECQVFDYEYGSFLASGNTCRAFLSFGCNCDLCCVIELPLFPSTVLWNVLRAEHWNAEAGEWLISLQISMMSV